MRILIHDYGGHPFQVQLSRALACRGHQVTHLYNGSNYTTPQGAVSRRVDDLGTLSIVPLLLPCSVNKTAFFKRWRLERLYGQRLSAAIKELQPEVVLLTNTPLDAVAAALRTCRHREIPMVFWLQDLIGEATERILGARLGIAGHLIGRYYIRKEQRLLRESAQVVGITEDFRPMVTAAGLPQGRYTTITNWAPLEEIVLRPRVNAWARSQGLDKGFVFLYSGTLGFKHNPALLLALAREFAGRPDVYVVINSQGDAADWLQAKGREEGLKRLRVNSYQAYDVMSDVMATADVLVSILEPEAGIFSVPSKVLSYHCAGRPILLAVPANNLAARIVESERTGLVADPHDEASFVAAAEWLYENTAARQSMATRARAYAERTFAIKRIADEFEMVLFAATGTAA